MIRTKMTATLALAFGTLLAFPEFCGSAAVQQPAGSGAQATKSQTQAATPAPGAVPAPKSAIANFAWLEGRWQGEWGPRVAEQVWLAPKAGEMVGLFRLVENDKTLVIELFTLVEKDGGVNFYFRHFTPELLPWEKSDATVLHLGDFDANKFDFENPVNGMPKRAILTRLDADTYVARSEIIPESGETQVIEITYHREKPAPEKPSAGSGGHRKKP
jgi:Domain of unknown function (DUF6265)